MAKVSAFMYGQDDIEIMYADALAHNEKIEDGSYHILVANPPYSVKGFLETLNVPDKRSFELIKSIDDKSIVTNNAIETFFIERAKQLLAPGGIAAIILPSSVLSNDAKQYQHARQILLKHFYIIAIAEMGSGTFGKTGTNTVTLFLKRRNAEPAEAEHYQHRVNSWLYKAELTNRYEKNKMYKDLHLLEMYCNHINIACNDYKALLTDEAPNEAIQQSEMWQEYVKAFYATTDIKNLQKKPAFKNQTEAQQQAELSEKLFRFVLKIEAEKLYYFLLAHSNAVPVLIIKSPADNKAMKKFLGYEWSAAKGNEGIKYLNAPPQSAAEEADEPTLITAQLNYIQTPLYNTAQKEDVTKLNYYIQQNYLGKSFILPENLSAFAFTTNLADMLDFSRKDFNKAILLTKKKTRELINKWQLKKLQDLSVLLQRGKSTSYGNSNIQVIKSGQARGGKEFDFTNPVFAANNFIADERNLKSGDVLINSTGYGTAGRVTYFNLDGNFVADNHITIFRTNNEINAEYVVLYFENYFGFKNLESLAKGISGQVELSLEDLKNLKIAVPPKEVQDSIVAECKVIDKAVTEARQTIQKAKDEIEKKIEQVFEKGIKQKISYVIDINVDSINPSVFPQQSFIYVDIDSIEKGEGVINYDKTITGLTAPSRARRLAKEGDTIISTVRPYLKGFAFINETKENIIYSTGFAILRTKNTNVILPKIIYYAFMYSNYLMNQMTSAMPKGSYPSINANDIENFLISVPPLPIQQQFVNEIEILEAQIATAKNSITNAPAQKQAVLKKWLE